MVPYELRQFTHAGVRLSYEVWGSGPRTIIYLHGILLTPTPTTAWPTTWPSWVTGWSSWTYRATG